jgi:hypothetical protein
MKPYGEEHFREARFLSREFSTNGLGYTERMAKTAWDNLCRIAKKLARHHAKQDIQRELRDLEA